jgi:hypothetical protein
LQLEVDRCNEEEARLMRERAAIQEWMLAEWEGIQAALNNAGVCGHQMLFVVVNGFAVADPVISFHLRSRADELVNICVVWKRKVQCIPCAWPVVGSWGPSDEALLRAACDQVQPSFRNDDDDDDDESVEAGDLEYGEIGEIGDEELMDAIEDIALGDAYRYDRGTDFEDDLDGVGGDFMLSSLIKPSQKRRCI